MSSEADDIKPTRVVRHVSPSPGSAVSSATDRQAAFLESLSQAVLAATGNLAAASLQLKETSAQLRDMAANVSESIALQTSVLSAAAHDNSYLRGAKGSNKLFDEGDDGDDDDRLHVSAFREQAVDSRSHASDNISNSNSKNKNRYTHSPLASSRAFDDSIVRIPSPASTAATAAAAAGVSTGVKGLRGREYERRMRDSNNSTVNHSSSSAKISNSSSSSKIWDEDDIAGYIKDTLRNKVSSVLEPLASKGSSSGSNINVSTP